MNFEETLDQAIAMLQRRGRVSYRTLKLQFQLDEESLAAIKEELSEVHHLATDQDGSMLVWAGAAPAMPAPSSRGESWSALWGRVGRRVGWMW